MSGRSGGKESGDVTGGHTGARSGGHPDPESDGRRLIEEHEARIRPLEVDLQRAWWMANTSGRDEDYREKEAAQNRLDEALADPDRFARMRAVRAAISKATPSDPLLARQVDLLYLQAMEKQVEPELLRRMSEISNRVEKAFNVFRAEVDGKAMTDSEVRKALRESTDSAYLRKVWEASKRVGRVVDSDLRELVRLRNEAARKLGFGDYHAMQLELTELSRDEVLRLFDELEALTREPYRALKAEIDARLAAIHGVPVQDLRPWHYQDPFFQEAPAIYEADLDAAFAGTDVVELCRRFYAGIGLPVDDVLSRSDMYERPGKSPHAFCTDIDREGDVRVLANIVGNEYWAGTMLHELGHAVYSSKNMPGSLPYLLRTEAHILATEGIAILFERFSKSAAWLRDLGVEVKDPEAFDATGRKLHRAHLLIFTAWCQVMLRFEAAMYADPDRDLDALWWDLVERYQEVRRPEGRKEPDHGSKIHVVSAPAYYHNYLLGQLFAAQLHDAIARDVLGTEPEGAVYGGRREVGEFLRRKVFAPGRSLEWRALTRSATGEDLSARSFARSVAPPVER